VLFVAIYMYLSKWFYDTFNGAASRAAHCDSFVGESLAVSDVSYARTLWR
jgi:hypothetical protein